MTETQAFAAFKAPAKINLFLHITGRRPDGYHELQSVFELLDYCDIVHLRTRLDGIVQRTDDVEGVDEGDDLCLRAARALQEYSGCALGVDVRLEKNIPIGGGLGGGSSDAATVLLALNRLWNLNLSRAELIQIGVKLGADVPIFIFGESAWAEGVGEKLQSISLSESWYLVLTPAVHVSTSIIFKHSELTRDTIPSKIAAFFKGYGHNDLAPVVCQEYPAVASALGWLKQFGDARMSGSGASVFCSFETEAEALQVLAQKPIGCRGFVAKSLGRHPLYDFA